MIHGNQTVHVPDAYSRYLSNMFRKTFDLFATPVSVEFRSDRNPFTEGRREKRQSSARPGKATAKNPGSKTQRASQQFARAKRKKAKRAAEKPGKATSRGRKRPPEKARIGSSSSRKRKR